MRIVKVKLENFRRYKEEVIVDFNDLTVFVGKNDIGKSTILEALDIFLNDNKGVIKIAKDDISKQTQDNNIDNSEIKITVIFDDLPDKLTIDSTNSTSLADEYLLNCNKKLEIIKIYPNAGKEKVYIKANHPTNNNCNNLLSIKIVDLKKILDENNIQCLNKSKSAEVRKSIWGHYLNSLNLKEINIDVTKEDAKNIWEQLKNIMPLYSLFQSDRKNSDGDSEVQNPMKFAVQEILKDEALKKSLDEIAKDVTDKLREVTNNTLAKLKEMDSDIAKNLNPAIPDSGSLKWVDVFKNVSILGDDDIPINKRGSGIKRLILLNFFRAEAERRQKKENIPSIIYAIEEPETSQHPNHQKKLIDAFIKLSEADKTQIILTTHSPSIVKMLDFKYLRLIKNEDCKKIINMNKSNLSYKSLNEVNFLAFGESDEEYHNELYGYIESERELVNYKKGREKLPYKMMDKNGETKDIKIDISEYIRHQIHHPENKNNVKFDNEKLQKSIADMREFIGKLTKKD